MNETKFKDEFIGFVDILGWKVKVKAAEAGTGMPLIEVLKELGTPEGQSRFKKYGPTICPKSTFAQRDLDFQLTRFSDCVIVSSEISSAGVINLVNHCWGAVIKLLNKGIMCRGYITRGSIYHSKDSEMIGSGYQEVLEKEPHVSAFKRKADERGTPFVEVDPYVCDYVNDQGDSCVKEMFSRYTKGDGKVVALFPFQTLCHSFMISGFGQKFDSEKEKKSNQNMRMWIIQFKERILAFTNKANPDVMCKVNHYIQALDEQLIVCDKTDEMIDRLMKPLGIKRTNKNL